jgi:hypothetical protein
MRLHWLKTLKNAALLSPCHNQSSLSHAVFCGIAIRPLNADSSIVVLDLFSRRAMF